MDNIVSSTQNTTVKAVRKLLGNRKYRQQKELAVAEGIHLAKSLVESQYTAELVIYSESAFVNEEVVVLTGHPQIASVDKLIVKDSIFESLSSVHASVGVMMVFKPRLATQPDRLVGNSLLLEDIQDPGNLGTILRTAAAAGAGAIYLSPGCASVWSPKVLRAGMGAQFSLELHEGADLVGLVEAAEVATLATDLSTEGSIYDYDLTQPAAWVFGNEGQGVSPELLAACTSRLTIPQAESAVESLNVSAAVAVCLFEQGRQQRSSVVL